MTDVLKQRLVGAIIVILAAVVLLPVLFDGAGYKERHLESRIPAEPVLAEVVINEPVNQRLPDTDAPAEPQPAVTIKAKPAVLAKAVEKIAPEIDLSADTPRLDAEGVTVAWTLQLASFKDEDNAKALRRQLIKAGYKVYTRKNGTLIKVFVGPDVQKTKLESLQGGIKKQFGLDGIIVRFTTR